MPPPTTDSLADILRALAEQATAEAAPDAYVVDVEVRGFQGSRVVSVFVDTDTGISLDETAAVSRALSATLDRDDIVKGRYRLDVSSPGADRPLTLARQLPRHIGRSLDVTYSSVESEVVTVTGVLKAADADAIELAVADSDATVSIPTDQLVEARVNLPW